MFLRCRDHCSFVCALVVCLRIATGSGNAQTVYTALPASFEAYLAAEVHPSASDRSRLLAGDPVTKMLPSDVSKEVAVFGAIWIDAPPATYVNRVKDIETFETGGAFRHTKKIGDPAAPEDFAAMELPHEDVKDLRRCTPGDCDVKLSAKGLEAFKTQVRWNTATEQADADAAFRRLALDYVNSYREGGNSRLAVYRDSEHPVFVADEFRSMIERMPSVARMPDLQNYLLEYPKAVLQDSSQFLYWQEAAFGLKPTIRINHLVIQDRAENTVIASKMLYASHYFWTALELRVLQSDAARGRGFWLLMINRSRSDGLKGFLGRLIRGRVRSEAQKSTEAVLRFTKRTLEGR